jgi:exopolysaccharide production protein ExoQ
MNPQLATVVYLVLILGLFWLDRERQLRVSAALWITTLWLLINGSRPVSIWLDPSLAVVNDSLEGSPTDAAVYGTLLAAALAVLFWRRQRTAKFLRANLPILLFFAYCAISVLWSDYSFIAFKRWIKSLADLAVVLVVVTELNPTAAIQRVLSRIAFILLPLSVLFIKYYPAIGRGYNPWTWQPTYGGVTLFKNLLGETCLIAGLGSVWSLMVASQEREGADRLRHIAPHAIMTAMAIYLFITADSMTAFAAFIFGGTLILLANLKLVRRKPATVHLLVAGVIVLSLCAIFLPGTDLVGSLGRDTTLTGRTAIWSAATSVAHNPVLGTGFESFWSGDRQHEIWRLINEPGIQEAHNGYLEVYLNLGWVGLILLAALIASGYRNVIAAWRQDRKMGSLRLGFFVSGLVFCFTEAGFRMMAVMWTIFLFSIIAVPPAKSRKRQLANEEQTRSTTTNSSTAYEDVLETV